MAQAHRGTTTLFQLSTGIAAPRSLRARSAWWGRGLAKPRSALIAHAFETLDWSASRPTWIRAMQPRSACSSGSASSEGLLANATRRRRSTGLRDLGCSGRSGPVLSDDASRGPLLDDRRVQGGVDVASGTTRPRPPRTVELAREHRRQGDRATGSTDLSPPGPGHCTHHSSSLTHAPGEQALHERNVSYARVGPAARRRGTAAGRFFAVTRGSERRASSRPRLRREDIAYAGGFLRCERNR